MTSHGRIIAFLLALVSTTATHVFAGQEWEVEVHGGVLASTNPDSGTAALPPLGPNIPAPGPLPTSFTRRVPSWYFGDGAAILNGILGQSPTQIVPLDPALQSRIVDRQAGGSLGVRVDRALSNRFAVEFSLDAAQGPLALRSASKQIVTASAASFTPVWTTLLTPAAGDATAFTSNATFDDNRGGQVITAGSLLINFLSESAFKPYLAVGAGYIAASDGPSATLVGNYRFVFAPGSVLLPINETDTVKIQAVAKNTMTWVIGGGVKYALGDRWGVRADLRDYVNHDVVRTVVTTTPTSVSGSTPTTLTFAFTQTAPLIIFSTSPLTASTLSTTLNQFQTFKGTGIVNQINVTAGIYWRF